MGNSRQSKIIDFLSDDDFSTLKIECIWENYDERPKIGVCKYCGMDIYSEKNLVVMKITNDIIHEQCYLDYCEDNKNMLTYCEHEFIKERRMQ